MASIRKFEEIEAWQKARELAKAIYAVTKDGAFARDFGLRDQIRRAAVSIMSNIAEGFGRGGNKELTQFLSIAKGSVAEVQSQLFVAQDVGYLNPTQFKALYEKAETTARLIGGLIRYLRKNNFKGSKYK
jgi:four helix bundle protein